MPNVRVTEKNKKNMCILETVRFNFIYEIKPYCSTTTPSIDCAPIFVTLRCQNQ
jgi:hypothetical protein